MALLPIWRSIETKLHAAVLVMSLLLVCSSPWIFIAKQLSPKAGFWDVFHVYGGLFTAVIGLLFAIKVCTKGQWRLFFPWLVADFNQLNADISGMVKGRLPLSGGKGLLSVIEGVGVGKGTKSQSKYAVKSNVLQLTEDGVGVGQGPDVK